MNWIFIPLYKWKVSEGIAECTEPRPGTRNGQYAISSLANRTQLAPLGRTLLV